MQMRQILKFGTYRVVRAVVQIAEDLGLENFAILSIAQLSQGMNNVWAQFRHLSLKKTTRCPIFTAVLGRMTANKCLFF